MRQECTSLCPSCDFLFHVRESEIFVYIDHPRQHILYTIPIPPPAPKWHTNGAGGAVKHQEQQQADTFIVCLFSNALNKAELERPPRRFTACQPTEAALSQR